MAVKLSLLRSTSLTNINANFERVKAALEDAVSRNGNVPNQMNADLDMNGFNIINVGNVEGGGETPSPGPVTVDQIVGLSEYVEDEIAASIIAGSNITTTYDDDSGLVTINAIVPPSVTDHGFLTGLGDDDHPQYYNQTRGDARYHRKNTTDFTEAVEDIVGAQIVAGTNVTVNYNDGTGKVTINAVGGEGGTGVTDHGALSGLSDDDHPQYHNDARGDVRYYTKGQVDSLVASSGGGNVFSPRQFGAIGNGSQANAAADTAGLQAALTALVNGNVGLNATATTLDLQGGNYYITDTLVAPTVAFCSNIRTTNGTIRFVDNVVNGTKYFIDLTPIGTLYYSKIDHINLMGARADNSTQAKGSIKFGRCGTFTIAFCNIHGFTENGIWQTDGNFGQHIRIEHNHIQAAFGGVFPTGSTGIDLAAGDSWIGHNTIGDCNQLIRVRQSTVQITGNHLWNFSTTSLKGILCDKAHALMITNNYIDTVQVELKGSTSGSEYHFHANLITGNKFYCPPDGIGGASLFTSARGFIRYMPTAANSYVVQDVIVGNVFASDNARNPMNVEYVTGSGSIAADRVDGFRLDLSSGFGVTMKTSDPEKDIFVNGTSATENFANLIPFGGIRYILAGCSVEGGTPVAVALTKSGTNVTATINPSANVVIHAKASINNSNRP